MTEIQTYLFSMQDLTYQAFQSKLIPSIDRSRVIGVRTPALRKFARELVGTPQAERFLSDLPHTFYEENNLHAFLLEQITDFQDLICALDTFLPYVDNWATCDSMSPRILARHKAELLPHLYRWMESGEIYRVRYAIGMLMKHYLTDAYTDEYPRRISGIKSDEYYVNMMVAWYFATALAVRYEDALPYLTERRLSPWIHRKAIQKATESYRLNSSQKQFLRGIR